ARPYLLSHPYRLHLPGLYGILPRPGGSVILLLDNVPIHPQTGEPLPALETALVTATPLRQAYWLWQMAELWQVLSGYGLATSLLHLETVRVEGWCLRLLELHPDVYPPSRANLAEVWRSLLPVLSPVIAESLIPLMDGMVSPEGSEEALALGLNQILLAQAASIPSRFVLAGATAQGPSQPRNEDVCWPNSTATPPPSSEGLQLAIVCDGVGGHEGGEVASQLALQSLQLQLPALLAETQKESQVMPPAVIRDQIKAVITVVNDLINFQNDNQARVGRQRMGTTLVMAVVLPQQLHTDQGWKRVQEVYLAQVGDSRAYWITPNYCHLLTVDDDIAGREVIAGRQILPLALQHPEARALTQALGTRSGERLDIHCQRFIFDEPGVLLLCSDGLSDNSRVEESWANYIGLIVKGIVSLEAAVAAWIELANQKNGHDNSAVVLLHHQILPPALTPPAPPESFDRPSPDRPSAALYGETREAEEPLPDPVDTSRSGINPGWWVLLVIVLGATLALTWWLKRPSLPEATPPTPAPSQSTP
ncbi:MAG: protein phosphatase 2C domain-containing protein, partial [Cyanobacteria bacterium REEB459]|nr:protein phosphatase 2C domain-containing protein [Cyanobacteria bacterium REEB459]